MTMASQVSQDKNAAKNFSQGSCLNSLRKLSQLKQESFTLCCSHVSIFEFKSSIESGNVYAMGDNSFGQLGIGHNNFDSGRGEDREFDIRENPTRLENL